MSWSGVYYVLLGIQSAPASELRIPKLVYLFEGHPSTQRLSLRFFSCLFHLFLVRQNASFWTTMYFSSNPFLCLSTPGGQKTPKNTEKKQNAPHHSYPRRRSQPVTPVTRSAPSPDHQSDQRRGAEEAHGASVLRPQSHRTETEVQLEAKVRGVMCCELDGAVRVFSFFYLWGTRLDCIDIIISIRHLSIYDMGPLFHCLDYLSRGSCHSISFRLL